MPCIHLVIIIIKFVKTEGTAESYKPYVVPML